jgi:hypothetical protein
VFKNYSICPTDSSTLDFCTSSEPSCGRTLPSLLLLLMIITFCEIDWFSLDSSSEFCRGINFRNFFFEILRVPNYIFNLPDSCLHHPGSTIPPQFLPHLPPFERVDSLVDVPCVVFDAASDDFFGRTPDYMLHRRDS